MAAPGRCCAARSTATRATGLGPAQDRTLLRLRAVRLRGRDSAVSRLGPARGGDRRLLAPLHRAHAGSGGEHQDRRAGHEEICHGPGLAPRRAAPASAAPAKRTSKPNARAGRWAFTSIGRNTKDLVPLRVRARSSSFCNLSSTNAHLQGLPDRRRAGHRRQHRRGHGRDRSVNKPWRLRCLRFFVTGRTV